MVAGVAWFVCVALVAELPTASLDGAEAQVRAKVTAFRDEVLQSSDDATAWGRYGMVLEAHGFAEESKIAYGQASSLDSGESRWPYYLAAAYESSDPERAVDLYLEAIDRAPDYAPARIRVAQTLEKLARDQEAWEHYARAVVLDRDNPFGSLGLGRIAMRQGRLDEAIRYLSRALELNPRMHATVSALARVFHRAGRGAEARALAEEAPELPRITYLPDPLRAEINHEAVDRNSYLRRSRTFIEVGSPEGALFELRTLIELDPSLAVAHLAIADLWARFGEFEKAEAAAREALRLDAGLSQARVRRATALFEMGRLGEAEAEARRALTSSRDDAEIHLLLSMLAAERGDDAAAIDHLQEAAAARPSESATRGLLAQLLAELSGAYAEVGQLDQAVAILEQAVGFAEQAPRIEGLEVYRKRLAQLRSRRSSR